jgi:uncharacterized membrane protein
MGLGPARLPRSLSCILLLALVIASSGAAQARSDPESGRIRILYIGDGWGPSPVPKYQVDPAFTVVSVPTSELHVGHGAISYDVPTMKKFVRLYMPRTYELLLANYDFIVISDANVLMMEQSHLDWIRRSVPEEGLGLIMVGGLESFGAPRGEPWTAVEDILPVTYIMGSMVQRAFKVRPAIDHPFTNSLPWESIPYFGGCNTISLRQGATLLLTAKEIPYPPLSVMDFGEGRGIAHASDWTPGAGEEVMKWEYYPDYVANIAYLATRKEIPQDAQLMHHLRTSFWSARSRMTLVIDTIAFVELFGANARGIEVGLEEVRGMVRQAEELYIGQDYQEAGVRIQEIDDRIVELYEETIKLKDRALVWVYAIEWTITTGTALLAGFVLWSLMVRRRLYRAVGSTRMAG